MTDGISKRHRNVAIVMTVVTVVLLLIAFTVYNNKVNEVGGQEQGVASEQGRKELIIAELRLFIDGKIEHGELSEQSVSALHEAMYPETESADPQVFDEVYSLAPGLFSPSDAKEIADAIVISETEYRKEVENFKESHAWVYELTEPMTLRQFLRVDAKKVYYLERMANRISHRKAENVLDVLRHIEPLDHVELSHSFRFFSPNTYAWNAMTMGIDFAMFSEEFDTYFADVLNSTGTKQFLLYHQNTNADYEPVLKNDFAYHWTSHLRVISGEKAIYFDGRSRITPMHIFDLDGRIIRFDISRTKFRVVFYQKGQPNKETTSALISLAKLIELTLEVKPGAEWKKVEESNVWEIETKSSDPRSL